MTTPKRYPTPGATRADVARRELFAIINEPAAAIRAAALAGWWRRWTASAGAMTALDPKALAEAIGHRDEIIATQREVRLQTVCNLLMVTPLVLREESSTDPITGALIDLSTVSLILSDPNPLALGSSSGGTVKANDHEPSA